MILRSTPWALALVSALTTAQTPPHPDSANTLLVCPPRETPAQGACNTRTIQAALRMAGDHDLVRLLPGKYPECMVIPGNHMTIDGPGAQLVGKACQGKAAIVIHDHSAVIRNLSCRDIRVPSENGSCVRFHGGDLTLQNVHFSDSQSGLLGGEGTLRITDSVFRRNGYKGQAHQVYFSGAQAELYIRNSKFLSATGEGHGIKSGARRLVLDNVVIDGTGGNMSRNIDAYNGGELVIENSILRKAPSDANREIIGYDFEKRVGHALNRIVLRNNVFDCGKGAYILAGMNSLRDAHIIVEGNQFLGNCHAVPRSRGKPAGQ